MDKQKRRMVEVFDSLDGEDLKSRYFIECTGKMDSEIKAELLNLGWEGKDERDFLELYTSKHQEKFNEGFFVDFPGENPEPAHKIKSVKTKYEQLRSLSTVKTKTVPK